MIAKQKHGSLILKPRMKNEMKEIQMKRQPGAKEQETLIA